MGNLKGLIHTANQRGVPSNKIALKTPQDLLKRAKQWKRNVKSTLHAEVRTSHHLRKLTGLLKKRECLPVRSEALDSVERLLKASIENDGHCVCEDCERKRRSKSQQLANEQQI